MGTETVKLTVRLPAELHRALKKRAIEYNVSLNQAVVETLASGLEEDRREESDLQKVDRLLREKGRLADASWISALVEGDDIPSLEEVRDWFEGVPLADWIIEDRGSAE